MPDEDGNETPEEMLERFKDMASRTTQLRDRMLLAANHPSASLRATAEIMIPRLQRDVQEWGEAIRRLEASIANGSAE